jgi:hypothetical protein
MHYSSGTNLERGGGGSSPRGGIRPFGKYILISNLSEIIFIPALHNVFRNRQTDTCRDKLEALYLITSGVLCPQNN